MQKTKLKICLACMRLFDHEHRHHALGYCFNEYRKMRYQKQLKPKHLTCVGKDHIGENTFSLELHHYANGLCRSCYNKARYVSTPKRYDCRQCAKYRPNLPINKVRFKNDACPECSAIMAPIRERAKQRQLEHRKNFGQQEKSS